MHACSPPFPPSPRRGRRRLAAGRTRLAAALAVAAALCGCAGGPPAGGAGTPAAAAAARQPGTLGRERIAALLDSADRSAADRANDLRRKPAELLAFIGVRPGMTVLDLSAGGGYTTELLARAVAPEGRAYGQSAPPRATPPRPPAAPEGGMAAPAPAAAASAAAAAPRRTSAEALAERARNPAAGNIAAVVRPFESPVPDELAGRLDLATLMFNYHDLVHMGVDRDRMNRAVYDALRPGGLYVIADHAGRPGTGDSEAGTLHRIEEAFLRREVERAGFVLAAEGAFLRNPADPRDRNTPEPPQPKDDFVLKFVRP